MTIVNLDVERLLGRIQSFLQEDRFADPGPASLAELRDIMASLIHLRFGEIQPGCDPVAAEIYDARQEVVKVLRYPRLDVLRAQGVSQGQSLADVMDSLELLSIETSSAIRALCSEISSQERARQAQARHVALCGGVRMWGEQLLAEDPRAGRLLIDYACGEPFPAVIDPDVIRSMGFDPEYFAGLLLRGREEDLRQHLCAMAVKVRGEDL